MTFRLNRRTVGAVLAVAMAAAAVVAVPSFSSQEASAASFYDTPTGLPARNGDVVRSEPSTFYLDPVNLIKADADVTRIMYRSTDRTGTPIAVTGAVLMPKSAWIGVGERPLVAYAAGTQGIGDHCAPSRQLTVGTEYEGPFVEGLLLRGYAVVMPDYQGLGTAGDHTYMNRAVQGHAVLDSLRAAQRLGVPGLPANGPVAVHGYSQGGGAAASAAELAPTYAPELNLKGVSAGAVPANLFKVAEQLDGSLYAAFLGYALVGMTAGYALPTEQHLNAAGRQFMADVREHCTIQALPKFAFTKTSTLTADGKPITDLLATNPRFASVIAEQRIGARKPGVPVLVSHSRLDDVIPYAVGKTLASDWCGKGVNLHLEPNLGPTHVGGAVAGYPAVFAWLEARFAGLPQLSNCWAVPFL